MTQRVTVKCVRGLRGEARNGVCYVGRNCAGWPSTIWGNWQRRPCPGPFRDHLLQMKPGELAMMLEGLWDRCRHGALPLGCWCLDWDGIGETPGCHAAVWAEFLNDRFVSPGRCVEHERDDRGAGGDLPRL